MHAKNSDNKIARKTGWENERIFCMAKRKSLSSAQSLILHIIFSLCFWRIVTNFGEQTINGSTMAMGSIFGIFYSPLTPKFILTQVKNNDDDRDNDDRNIITITLQPMIRLKVIFLQCVLHVWCIFPLIKLIMTINLLATYIAVVIENFQTLKECLP